MTINLTPLHTRQRLQLQGTMWAAATTSPQHRGRSTSSGVAYPGQVATHTCTSLAQHTSQSLFFFWFSLSYLDYYSAF